jgi:protein-S-isoprenylcysteine O-methyltransferase Ste14
MYCDNCSPGGSGRVALSVRSTIRNPIYVFSELAIAGLILYVKKPRLLLLLMILVPLQIFRARQESRVLEEKSGEEYRRYKAATWF